MLDPKTIKTRLLSNGHNTQSKLEQLMIMKHLFNLDFNLIYKLRRKLYFDKEQLWTNDDKTYYLDGNTSSKDFFLINITIVNNM